MLKELIPKKTRDDPTVLPKEKYFSEKAFEIYSKKYTSSFSESHRNYCFLGKLSVDQNFAISKMIFFQAISDWLEGKIRFTGENASKLGDKLSLTVQGTRKTIMVTGLKEETDFYSITFFSELENALMWDTFYLSKPLFFGKKYFLWFKQEICFNATQDAYSPQGLASRFLIKRSSRLTFELFTKDFIAAKEKLLLTKSQDSKTKK